MKCYVGIDLGSTTTKSIVLDEKGVVLGRGITNSRSNYDVACQVARSEAFMDARFNLCRPRLEPIVNAEDGCGPLLDALRRSFKLEQHLHQLGELEATCRMNAERTGKPEERALLPEIFDELFEELRRRAVELFGNKSRARSDFFRDIAGSDYMAIAEGLVRERPVEYELLLAIYDKSIIAVENHIPTLFLHEMIHRALHRSLQEYPSFREHEKALVAEIDAVIDVALTEDVSVGTGYGRARLPFPRECIRSEILCHGLGAHAIFPGTRTVLDIGGQDTKAIQVDGNGVVTSFQMNDRCAAGCGRYLGYIADEMSLGLHELGPLAKCSNRPVRINSTCTVFAGAELRDRLAVGQRREDILAGLHRAIMLRAMSLLARSGGVHEEFTFTGGVAKNEAAVEALFGLVADNYGERTINVSPDSIYTGALGAGIFALRDGIGELDAMPVPAIQGGVG